jgi:hypothetical protein
MGVTRQEVAMARSRRRRERRPPLRIAAGVLVVAAVTIAVVRALRRIRVYD